MRQTFALSKGNGPELIFDGKTYLNFSSNDYLGLAHDPDLICHWQEGLSRFGCGSGASPLVTGFSIAHRNLQSALCDWLGYERAILFNSGFSANQAVLFTLLKRHDLLLQDRLNHASLMEAGLLAPATMKRFRHNDVDHLAGLLDCDRANFVVTEGTFSMDGDRAPVAQLCDLLEGRATLMVDDAHGIGVLGEEGAGSCALAGVKPDLLLVTFGKGFGLAGAALLCDEGMGEYLSQFARHYVYSTAMPPAQAYALTCAVHMIRTQHWRREKLKELQQVYDTCVSAIDGFVRTETPIKPLIIGDTLQAQGVADLLKQDRIWISAIRPPTVPEGTARLRVTLTAAHTEQQVRGLAQSLQIAIEGMDHA
jgi:8-amino-7-oxononanoate synthase